MKIENWVSSVGELQGIAVGILAVCHPVHVHGEDDMTTGFDFHGSPFKGQLMIRALPSGSLKIKSRRP